MKSKKSRCHRHALQIKQLIGDKTPTETVLGHYINRNKDAVWEKAGPLQ